MNINVFFKHTLSDLAGSGFCVDFMLAGSTLEAWWKVKGFGKTLLLVWFFCPDPLLKDF